MRAPNTSDTVSKRVMDGLYAVRWLILLAVFLESRLKFTSAHLDRREIQVSVVIMAILLLLVRLAPKKLSERFRQLVTIIVDIGFVTVVVYFSDGIQSPFYPLYFLTLISAAVSLGTLGGVVWAFVVGALSLGIEVVEAGGRLSGILVVDDAVSTFPYLFLIAAITGAMRDRIQALAETTARLRADRAATEREMEVARRVQMAQLPAAVPEIAGLEIVVMYKPAREVGGDLYEFAPVEDGRVGIAVADVSGKGVPAALLVSTAKFALLEDYSEDRPSMMAKVNEHLLSLTTDDSFVTMIYGMLSVQGREFKYINAGHMPPVLVKRITGETITGLHSDPPLGIADNIGYLEQSLQLEPGDTLVLFTDGVTDAMEIEGDGAEAFYAFLRELNGKDLRDWPTELTEKISKPQHLDDATMVAIRLK